MAAVMTKLMGVTMGEDLFLVLNMAGEIQGIKPSTLARILVTEGCVNRGWLPNPADRIKARAAAEAAKVVANG